MRSAILFLLAFVVLTATSLGQRPWTPVSAPNVGLVPQLAFTSGAAYIFDASAAVTYNRGAGWDTIGTVTPMCKAIVEYVNNTTLAISQADGSDTVQTYYTVTGITWTPSDVLDLNGHHVITTDVTGTIVYIATQEGMIYAWADHVDSADIGLGDGTLVDFISTSNVLAANTTHGLMTSTNGAAWELNNPPTNRDRSYVTTAITKRDNILYAATDKGVFRYDVESNSWMPVGTWSSEMTLWEISALAADNSHLIAMCKTSDERHQLYRLELPDTNWIVTGREIPMDQPSMTTHALIIDAGWALTYQTSAVEPDSNGLYMYNLNDFTSVKDLATDSEIRIVQTSVGVTIESIWQGALAVDILTLNGQLVHSCETQAPYAEIPLSNNIHGVVCVIVRAENGKVARALLAR